MSSWGATAVAALLFLSCPRETPPCQRLCPHLPPSWRYFAFIPYRLSPWDATEAAAVPSPPRHPGVTWHSIGTY